jgi:hypothetical protein
MTLAWHFTDGLECVKRCSCGVAFGIERHLRAELAALRARVALLEELLHEWRGTPFFQYPDDWEEWVAEFGSRVDAALRGAMEKR